jgi:diacylglycerol kinase family enzyme
LPTLGVLRQMLGVGPPRTPGGKHVLSLHDLAEFEFRAGRPIAFQVDGEYVGERERVWFRSVPSALRVLA